MIVKTFRKVLVHGCAVTLAAAVLTQTAQAADSRVRDRLSGMSALDSALGPLPPDARPDRPFPNAGNVTGAQSRTDTRRSDARGSEARTPDIRNADIRRDNFRREELEEDAKNMHSANRGSAIEGVSLRDPRAAAGARARSEAAAQVNPGPVGGMLLNGSAGGNAAAAAGADSRAGSAAATGARSGAGLSGGSVIGGVSAVGEPAKPRW